MAVTAAQLSKSGAKGKDLDSIVREQLVIIDDHLMRAERTWGRNILAHELPINFSFPGLEKRDCQRIIYTSIIRSLRDREFDVRIFMKGDRTILYIEWVTDLNSEEIEAMNKLLSKVCFRSEKELEEYLQDPRPHGSGTASAAASAATIHGGARSG